MEIAYVTPYYNGDCDGRYGRFHDWVHALRDSGHPPFDFDVHAFAASNGDRTLASPPGAYLGGAEDLWDRKKNKGEYLLNSPRVRRDLRRKAYDLVHVLVMDLIVYPTVLSAVDVPVVVGPDISGWTPIRQGTFWGTGPAARVKQRAGFNLRRLLSRVGRYDRVMAFSDHHRRMLLEMGFDPADIAPLRPGVDPRFHPGDAGTNDPPEILFVGDFSEHKGYPEFLRALARLDAEFTARLVGSGDARLPLIESLGLSDDVVVEGFVPRGELADRYRAADLFVVPSIDEMGPNTQVEALACGTPVVATDRPGLNEYPPDGTAVYFWPREPEALAGAIETALRDLRKMTDAAMRHAGEFDVRHTIEDLHSLYSSLLDEEQ